MLCNVLRHIVIIFTYPGNKAVVNHVKDFVVVMVNLSVLKQVGGYVDVFKSITAFEVRL